MKLTELNNETTTSLACGKERGLKRARLKTAFDSRENHGRVFKTENFFFIHDIFPFSTLRGTKLLFEGIRLV